VIDITTEKYYNELSKLSREGLFNMWKADDYLVKKFNIKKELATEIFEDWVENYSETEEGSEWNVLYGD